MAKVSVIGAGNVGATCANAMLHMKFCSEIVLLDIKEGVSEGKALDMTQTANLYQFNTKITGVTNDYKATAKSLCVRFEIKVSSSETIPIMFFTPSKIPSE